jgi:hypothetical protein
MSEELLKEENNVSLPLGHYLFVQRRTALDSPKMGEEEWLNMEIKKKKDGLWERHKLKSILYVRFLYEDGAFVTQVFRPIV